MKKGIRLVSKNSREYMGETLNTLGNIMTDSEKRAAQKDGVSHREYYEKKIGKYKAKQLLAQGKSVLYTAMKTGLSEFVVQAIQDGLVTVKDMNLNTPIRTPLASVTLTDLPKDIHGDYNAVIDRLNLDKDEIDRFISALSLSDICDELDEERKYKVDNIITDMIELIRDGLGEDIIASNSKIIKDFESKYMVLLTKTNKSNVSIVFDLLYRDSIKIAEKIGVEQSNIMTCAVKQCVQTLRNTCWIESEE